MTRLELEHEEDLFLLMVHKPTCPCRVSPSRPQRRWWLSWSPAAALMAVPAAEAPPADIHVVIPDAEPFDHPGVPDLQSHEAQLVIRQPLHRRG